MTSLVFVPLRRSEALALQAGTDLGTCPGCAPTAGLAASLGPDPGREELEFAAMNNAGVLALSLEYDPLRLILAAEVADRQVGDRGGDLGEVTVARLHWGQVHALFADEPAAAPSVDQARAAVAGRGLAEALATPAVEALLGGFDLLWFAPGELDQLMPGTG